METKLKVIKSNFQSELSFNDWCKHTKVSSRWDANNEKNKSFIEKYTNYKFAERFLNKKLSNEEVI